MAHWTRRDFVKTGAMELPRRRPSMYFKDVQFAGV